MQVAFLAAAFFWAFLSAPALALVLAVVLALVLALTASVCLGAAGSRVSGWAQRLVALQHRGHGRRLHFFLSHGSLQAKKQ